MRSTLILSKSDGAIIRSTGLTLEYTASPTDPAASQEGYRDDQEKKQKTAEEVAKMVFAFVNAAGALAGGMDEGNGDDVQLLRLRTRRNEFVIVPGK